MYDLEYQLAVGESLRLAQQAPLRGLEIDRLYPLKGHREIPIPQHRVLPVG